MPKQVRGAMAPERIDDVRVLEDLFRRRASRRAFLPDRAPKAIIEKIFEIAQLSPSDWTSQPWKVTLCSGSAARAFGEALCAHAVDAVGAPNLPFPREYRGVYRERPREAAWALFENVGVKQGDRRGSAIQNAENFRFFAAPHVAIVTSDEAPGGYGVVDCCIYVNSLLLAAEAAGVSAVAPGAAVEQLSASQLPTLPIIYSDRRESVAASLRRSSKAASSRFQTFWNTFAELRAVCRGGVSASEAASD